MKYRKKPVTIEAFDCDVVCHYASHSWKNVPKCIRDAYEKGEILFTPEGVEIKTLEGWMKGALSDKIIQGVNGELYPCKPDIFEKTYEKVEE